MSANPEDTRISEAAAWQGTLPRAGTRRAIVLAAIEAFSEDLGVAASPELADAVELALLQAVEQGGPVAIEGGETWQVEFPEVNDPATDDDPKWCWRLNAAGEIVMQSEGYPTKEKAEEMAEIFKSHAVRAGVPLGAS